MSPFFISPVHELEEFQKSTVIFCVSLIKKVNLFPDQLPPEKSPKRVFATQLNFKVISYFDMRLVIEQVSILLPKLVGERILLFQAK